MGFGQNLWYALTAMGGPGDHPGMARKAAAGPMDAGSDVVATTSTTIFSSSDSNTPAAPPNTYTTSTWESTLDYCGATALVRHNTLVEDQPTEVRGFRGLEYCLEV
jgi:hypothetical protein